MKYLKINNKPLKGEIKVPPSKSDAHRAIICAALASGRSRVENVDLSQDMIATMDGMRKLGADIRVEEGEKYNTLIIDGISRKSGNVEIDCCESGSTLRFLIPVIIHICGEGIVIGRGKLVERPLDVYYKIFKEFGIEYGNKDGKLPLHFKGELKSGVYKMRGDISSQFISGLLFVLPLLKGNSKIEITTELQSKAYVDMTIKSLKDFGVEVENNKYKEFIIEGGQKYQPRDYVVEGDYSQSAFWFAAGVLGEELEIKGLKDFSNQGDRAVMDILKKMGGKINSQKDYYKVEKSTTEGITIDVSECPDVAPILTVVGALSKGVTKIINAGRLRIKESDRLHSITTELNKLGASIEEGEDFLVIEGVEALSGGIVDSWNDHRIAMALSIASIKCKEPLYLEGWNSIDKSYPKFYEDFQSVGGVVDECQLGE